MTILLFALLGGAAGSVLLGAVPEGFWVGAVFGALAGWIARLARRIDVLERQLKGAAAHERAPPAETARGSREPQAGVTAPSAADSARERRGPHEPPRPAPPYATATGASTRGAEVSAATDSAAKPPDAAVHAPPPYAAAARARSSSAERPSAPSLLDTALERAKRWLTTGNVPVKVGVVLSVFGVGFLVKEGIDRNWLVLPLELRLALVAAFGVALLAIGWRLRASNRTYAVSVQGGGIAVLYLTTFASFALYDLLPAVAAFVVLVVITAGAGTLAVLQNSRGLAVLGIAGGFMAPVLTSSGSGNHVALFTYYAILNLAILGIAWFKAWRELNVLGFLFTFFIGSLWGYTGYTPQRFATTEPFLVFFVLLYTLVPVLFATRSAPKLRGFVDGTLLFGTPIAGFALQSQLVGDTRFGLALSAVALALWYVALATYLYRRRAPALQVLVEALLALGVAFATVAVPLALDARWTSAAWALQGAAMVWLGFRQERKLALAAGCALQLLGGASYFLQPFGAPVEWPLVNGYFLGAVLIAAAGWLTSRLFDRARAAHGNGLPLVAAAAAFIWATGWWLMAGFAEVDRHVAAAVEPAARTGFIAVTVLLALGVSRAVRWPALGLAALVLWPFAAAAVANAFAGQSHPFADYGWLAWPALVVCAYVFLRQRETSLPHLRSVLHATAFWLVAWLIGTETAWLVDRYADGIWPLAAALATSSTLVLGTLALRAAIEWPLRAHMATYVRMGAGAVLAVVAALMLVANLVSPGAAAPLRYVPLLNPLELASAFVVLVGFRWLRADAALSDRALEPRKLGVAAALLALYLLTMAVARAVHHYTGVPFNPETLADSSVLQAALSIVWGSAGLAGMLVGARRKRRAVWIGGAVLMAVVVVKLFLVELDNTGTLGRVISFLGVGLLLLVVGYFAPVPPRTELERRPA